jgi:formate-dependent nitrite reductase membrane component NrfD
MNVFVADPDWGWLIVSYFFLGGVAAGAYFTATLLDLAVGERAARLARIGYTLALPLAIICGLLLTIDLGRPERFWHMLFQSGETERVLHGEGSAVGGLLAFKPWSPMSVGSWGLTLFGICSALSLIGEWFPAARWLRRGVFARILQVVGCLAGFFLAAYTGTLLSATNQPLWSDTTWLAPLFLTSAGSTGVAAILLLALRRTSPSDDEAVENLEDADRMILLLEAGAFAVFLAFLGSWLPLVWATWHGKVLLAALVLGVAAPFALHLRRKRGRAVTLAAACLALLGGFLLRYGVVFIAPELLEHQRAAIAARTPPLPPGTPGPASPWGGAISPEDGRPQGARGADPLNRPAHFEPRSKIPIEDAP